MKTIVIASILLGASTAMADRARDLSDAAEVAGREGRFEAALAGFEEAAQLAPEVPEFACNIAMANYALARYPEAHRWFMRCRKLAPLPAAAEAALTYIEAELAKTGYVFPAEEPVSATTVEAPPSVAAPGPPPAPRRPPAGRARRSWARPALLAGAGALALGGVSYGVMAYYGDTAGDAPDAESYERAAGRFELFNTTGAVLVATGAALAATGTILWFLDRKVPRDTRLAVIPSASGASLVLEVTR